MMNHVILLLISTIPSCVLSTHTFMGGTMQYKIPERVTGCGNLQQCPVELALRIHVASGTVLTGNAPDWGTIDMGDGTITSISSLTIKHVVTNSVNEYDTYEMRWEHNYTTSSTFALACQNSDVGCSFDVVVTTNSNLQCTPCTATGAGNTCHLNAAGQNHQLHMKIYDLSLNVGSPIFVARGVQTVFRTGEFSVHLDLIDQVDTRVVRNSDILQNSNLPTWGSFNMSLTRPYNPNEWEYTVTETLASDLNENTPNVVVTTSFSTSSETEDEGTYINSDVNLTITTYSVSTVGTNPKLSVDQTVVYDNVGCFAAATWTQYVLSTDQPRIFPPCDGDEATPWVLIGSVNTASSTGNAGPCPEVADVTGADSIGYYRCDISTVSTRTSLYGKMKNQDGTGFEDTPEIDVMNAQGEFQFSTGATSETEFESVMYVSNVDNTEFRITSQGQYMSVVSAEDAQGSCIENIWTVRVMDLPMVCEVDPSLTCSNAGNCPSGSCSLLQTSTVVSAGPDANMVRPQCFVTFDVVARSSGNFARPTAIFAHHLPQGATFGSCAEVNSTDTKCTFSWDVPSDVSGDFRVCFAAVDGGKYEGEDTFCQSIRIIGSDVETNLLKLSLPTLDEIQICSSRTLFWYDAVVELGNTNQVTLYECDETASNCGVIASGISSDTYCTSSGLCSYTWNVEERAIIGNVTVRVKSDIIHSTCQSDSSELVALVKRPSPYTILSPGGGCGGSGGFVKGCYSSSSGEENLFSFSVLSQDSLSIDVEICTNDETSCHSIQQNKTYAPGTHIENVNITSSDAIYAFLTPNNQYIARLRTTCYADVSNEFIVTKRNGTYLGVELSHPSPWYGCYAYTATVTPIDSKNIGAVQLSRTGSNSGSLSTNSLTYVGNNAKSFTMTHNEVKETVTFTASATDFEDDCIPPNNQVMYTMADYPIDTIELISPSSFVLKTCEDTAITGDWNSAFSSMSMGTIHWTLTDISSSTIAGSGSSGSSIRPVEADVGKTWTLNMLPSSPALSACMSGGYDFTLTVQSGDRPLMFSEATPTAWYPCTNVTISWTSTFANFVAGSVNVDLTLTDDSTGIVTTMLSGVDSSTMSYTYSVPSTQSPGTYTLRLSPTVSQEVGCFSDATASITMKSWDDNEITITGYPLNGMYVCNSFDFQWSAITSATDLDICVCSDCTTITGAQNCYISDTDSLNLNLPVNTVPSTPSGTNYIFVTPANNDVAACLAHASQSFQVLETEVNITAPIDNDVWLPYCSYNIAWDSPFELGPLRIDLCLDGNCTHQSTVLLDDTTNADLDFVVDPSLISGWDGMSVESNVLIRVTATDYEGATIYEGCNYSAYKTVRMSAKEEAEQNNCRDSSNSAYIPPPPASVPWEVIIPIAAAVLFVVLGSIYFIYRKGRLAASKERHAIQLTEFAIDRHQKIENADHLALERGRMSTGNGRMRRGTNDAEYTLMQEKLDRLEVKLRKAKRIAEYLNKDDSFDDDRVARDKEDEGGFAAELMSDL